MSGGCDGGKEWQEADEGQEGSNSDSTITSCQVQGESQVSCQVGWNGKRFLSSPIHIFLLVFEFAKATTAMKFTLVLSQKIPRELPPLRQFSFLKLDFDD